jgi:hypothetical protein
LFSFCRDTYLQLAYTTGLIIAAALVITLVNGILKWVITKMGTFSRYKTETREVSGNTTKLFVSFFINTALITIIVTKSINNPLVTS